MSTALWTPHSGMSRIIFEGNIEMRDMHIPIAGKDEWGVDTLEREVRGPASLFLAYGNALRQGSGYNGFFLQTWRPINHHVFPGYSLSYKGLTNGIPNPLISNQRHELVSSLSASGLSVSANGKTITSATKELKYISPCTVYRYITTGEPNGPSYGAARGGEIQDLSSTTTVTYSDGSTAVLAGSAPAGVATALNTTPYFFVIGPNANLIIGTPYWEAEDLVQLKYAGS